MAKPGDETGTWQDSEIRFDAPLSQLALRPGEFQIDGIGSVEDTKGNNGEKGMLSITNLRLIWQCQRNSKVNLSIGYGAIISLNIRNANSRLRGSTQALFVMTKFNAARFEFVFTNLVKESPRLFTTVQAVYRAYDTSRLYRDLKLRAAIVKGKQLVQLPGEEICSRVDGVWNLSSDQGNLGTFFITNIRVVWFAKQSENFNVSIPYMQIRQVRIRDSKFGPALVVDTTARSGGYVLGFRLDPKEALDTVFKEVKSLHEIFGRKPIFGVQYSVEEQPASMESLTTKRETDDVEIIGGGAEDGTATTMAAYYADDGHSSERDIVLSDELGIAIEAPPEGLTLKSLWGVV